jgi:hypothetical protein
MFGSHRIGHHIMREEVCGVNPWAETALVRRFDLATEKVVDTVLIVCRRYLGI